MHRAGAGIGLGEGGLGAGIGLGGEGLGAGIGLGGEGLGAGTGGGLVSKRKAINFAFYNLE